MGSQLTWLYGTLKVIVMVFAASVEQLATKINQIMVSSAELAAKTSFVPIAITGGVLADDAMKLFKT